MESLDWMEFIALISEKCQKMRANIGNHKFQGSNMEE